MERQLGPVWTGGCIIVALIVTIATAGVLKLLATPEGYQDRLAAMEQKVIRAEKLAQMPGDSAAYPKGAICEGLSEAGFQKVRQGFEEAAAAEGLQGMQLVWGEPIDAGARIAPLPLSLRIEGPYEKVASFTDRLSRGAPTVFIDTADITASAAGAQLSLSGKVFCWTRV
jgi:Type II secretion system (T2SS), protein M subtype b